MKKNPKKTFLAWVERLQAEGRASFTKAEAALAYADGKALVRAIDRLVKAKVLSKPRHGFYLILDPPYRAMGSLPPEWFIDPLMRHLELPYYVGGLSAAALHGSSHHAVQEFQVMVPGDRVGLRPISFGRVRIRFFRKSAFKAATPVEMKAQTGYFKASGPEATAWDLVYFQRQLGGLDQVGTVLRDMAEKLDPQRLASVAKDHGDDLNARRLGYLLEVAGAKDPSDALKPLVPDNAPWRLLSPAEKAEQRPERHPVWRLLINHRLELEP